MCKFCQSAETLERIDEMVNDDDHKFVFAYDTLTGIRESIDSAGHVTPKQKQAIENIFNSKRS